MVGETKTLLSSFPAMTRKSKLRRKQSNDQPTTTTTAISHSSATTATTPASAGRKRDPTRSTFPSTTTKDDSSTGTTGSAAGADQDDAMINHSHSIDRHSGGGYYSATDDEDGEGNRNRGNDEYEFDDDDDHRSVDSTHGAPPFVPLEEHNRSRGKHRRRHARGFRRWSSLLPSNPLSIIPDPVARYVPSGKQVVSTAMMGLIVLVLYDALLRAPEDRILKPEKSLALLVWVQHHPLSGLFWITIMIAACVVVMIPLGTPLTLGCGYVYKGAYGWKLGVLVATIVSMGGSCLGAVICFLLGRYLMRDTVKKWVRKYPLFDAIDVAAAEHGLKIMMMLYLTPVLPLGPVSYMCGTTSMPLSSFVIAKVAALPLMLLYVFIGASMGTLIGGDATQAAAEVQQIEENEYLIASGILLSFVMIACITRQVKKELNKILERQQKLKPGEADVSTLAGIPSASSAAVVDDSGLEMGMTKRRRGAAD